MADTKISALTAATSLGSSDVVPIVQGGANKKASISLFNSSLAAPIDLAYADITTETNAGNLIDGQLYHITGFPVLTSGVQFDDVMVRASYDTANALSVLSPFCTASISNPGVINTMQMAYDWYGSRGILSLQTKWNNIIRGDINCNSFYFGIEGADNHDNVIGEDFILDLSLLTGKFIGNTCTGSFVWAAKSGFDYVGIDFNKGYFVHSGRATQISVAAPTIETYVNEIGGDITTEYRSQGLYDILYSKPWLGDTDENVWANIAQPSPLMIGGGYELNMAYASGVRIDFNAGLFGSSTDGVLNKTPFEVRVYDIIQAPQGTRKQFTFTVDKPIGNLVLQFEVKTFLASDNDTPLIVDFGDGTVKSFSVVGGSLGVGIEALHTYAAAGIYNCVVYCAGSILDIELQGNDFPSPNATSIDVTGLSSLIVLNLYGNNLTDSPSISTLASLTNISLVTNNIPSSGVNTTLASLVSLGWNSGAYTAEFVSQTPAAPPTGAGITAYNTLIAAGVNVTTD
jgi:hypothetical protein